MMCPFKELNKYKRKKGLPGNIGGGRKRTQDAPKNVLLFLNPERFPPQLFQPKQADLDKLFVELVA